MTSPALWRTAVVVFGQARGADYAEAQFAVERAVGQALKKSEMVGLKRSPNATHRGLWLPVAYNSPHPPAVAEVLDYSELNTAFMSGKLMMSVSLRGHE